MLDYVEKIFTQGGPFYTADPDKTTVEEGDIVNIIAPNGQKIGLGRSAYSSTEASTLVGKHDVKPIVHYDYLIVDELTS